MEPTVNIFETDVNDYKEVEALKQEIALTYKNNEVLAFTQNVSDGIMYTTMIHKERIFHG